MNRMVMMYDDDLGSDYEGMIFADDDISPISNKTKKLKL